MELVLGKNNIDYLMKETLKYPFLSQEEEYVLTTKYKKDSCAKSAQTLVMSNMKFLMSLANEFHREYKVDRMDLIQEGVIGLMIALKKFEPDRGVRLITYAKPWIKSMIQKYIVKNISIIGTGTRDKWNNLFARNGKTYIPEETSLDKPLLEDSSQTMGDILMDEGQETTEDSYLRKDQTAIVADVLKSVNEKDMFVIKNRLMVDDPMTFAEIADHFNITREGARQLTQRAQNRIAKKLEFLT